MIIIWCCCIEILFTVWSEQNLLSGSVIEYSEELGILMEWRERIPFHKEEVERLND